MPTKGVDIIFSGGIDESMDDKVRPGDSLKTARNVVYNYDGLLEKRHGFDNVSLSAFDYDTNTTSNISPSQLLATNSELLAYANGVVYSRLSSGGFIQRDKWLQVDAQSRHVASTGGRVSSFDQAYCNGYDVYAWCSDIGASNVPLCYTKIIDRATGAILLDVAQVDATAASSVAYSCRVLALGTYAVVLYYNGSGVLYARTINLASSTPQWSAAQTISSATIDTTYTHGIWDACEIEGSSTSFAVGYYSSTAPTGARIDMVTVSNTGGTLTTATPVYQLLVGVGVVARGIGLRANSSDDRIYAGVALYGATTVVQTARWTATAPISTVSGFTAIGGGGDVITIGGDRRVRITVSRRAANDVIVVCSHFQGSRDTWIARTTDFGTATPAQFRLRDYEVVSRTIEAPDGRFLAHARYADQQEGCGVVFDVGYPFSNSSTANTFTGFHVARLFPRLVPQSIGVTQVASSPTNTSNTYDLPCIVSLSEDARADLHSTTLVLSPQEGAQSKHLDGVLYTAGGWPGLYDGSRVIELGYDYPPPTLDASSVGSGGSLANGAYQWAAHYEWLDARGKIHRSPVTYSSSVNITSGNGAAGSANLIIPPLVITQRSDEEARDPQVYVALYRTLVNTTDSYLRLYSGARSNVFCYPNQANITYQDTDPDATISGNEPLYTDANALEPQGAPATRAICAHQGRIFGINHDASIWYSTEAVYEEPVAYNDAQVIAEFEGGQPVALASLDNALLVFKKSSVWAILGEGPDITGAGTAFSKPVRIASDVGVTDWRGVVETPKGVMFYGPKGLYLVNRAKEIVWIGKKVRKTLESYPVVTNSVLHPTGRWVLFSCKASETSTSGLILCYDLERDAWTTWDISANTGTAITPFRAPKSMAATGDLFVLTPDAVLKSNTSNFRDNGIWTTMNIETGEVKSSLQGYALLRRFYILGTRVSNTGLNVQVARNFSSTYDTFVASYSDSDLLALERDQYRISPEKKKGMSFRIKITDFDSATTGNGKGMKIQGLTCNIAPISDQFQLTANGAQR